MTAESLKPFLTLPNATASELKAQCARKSSVKRCLVALGCVLLAVLCLALVGVQIWHLNKTATLEREVDDLKLQLQVYNRASEFNDYELDNELFVNPDEYEGGYEPELDVDLPDELEAGELLASGLTSSGMHGEDEEDERNGEDTVARRNEDDDDDDDDGSEDDNEGGDEDEGDEDQDDATLYDTEDISVSSAVAGGKRLARSISGVTRQGVPIVDEPYVPHRNRTRRPHRIFEQLRQRPEELVTPPSAPEMFRWDVEGRSTHTSQRASATVQSQHQQQAQQQQYGSISIRPFQAELYQRRDQQGSTTPMPAGRDAPASPQYYSRNELNSALPTKAPAQILNRMSRVQATGDNMREKQQPQHTRFPKVVSNPGTQKEFVRSPETRVRMRHRKAGGSQHPAEPVAKGVHLVKQYVNGVRHRNTRHTHWTAKDTVNQQAIASRTFGFDGEQLTVKEPGLYYIYAQITYDNQHDVNGFKVLVGGQKHLSCTVHSRGENTNTCFTAGLAEIARPDTPILVEDVDHGRQHVMYPEKTFFGAFKVGRLATPAATAPGTAHQQQQIRMTRKALV